MRKTKREILADVDLETVKNTKVIGCNTVEIEYENGDRAIRLHNTNIITRKKDGDVVFNSDGWRTPTTKNRIAEFSTYYIYSEKGIWYITNDRDGNDQVFYDGITFNKDGELKSKGKTVNFKRLNKVKRDIAKYVKLVDNVEKLPIPSPGDCWDCRMEDKETGKTLGDIKETHDHLKLHIKEGYIFGSILYNAMREAGYKDEQIAFHFQLDIRGNIKRALRKYLYKRLLAKAV